jgi:hypothetical protein
VPIQSVSRLIGMPRIDPLLTAMVSNRADAVRLADGDIAHIIKGGAKHPLTRQPLGDGQAQRMSSSSTRMVKDVSSRGSRARTELFRRW